LGGADASVSSKIPAMAPVTLAALRVEMELGFRAAGPQPWPAPRGMLERPADAEYSRCLHPEKYVITQQRATAWASALINAGVATTASPGLRDLPPWGPVVTTSIVPTREGAEPVFVHFTHQHLPGVVVGYGSPQVVLIARPVCGCDACDDGSDVLIEAIDEAFESVILGEVLIEHDDHHTRVVTRNTESTSTSDRSDATRVAGRWSGTAWLG